ncbi:MAG: hydantoinase/oxoprolinase family protein [Methanomassiliicoccales archaeon]|nr:MAG: hydantoinase/oxoprolinase family protein [Methanomassiliicoccales archaeon]
MVQISSTSDRDRSTNYGLGIDTGGTYTDVALVDFRTLKVLAKAKARTTHHDLSIGLGEGVDKVMSYVDEHFEPSLVGVSTTLATNSVLEGRLGRVGLIGLGWTPQEGKEFGAKKQCFLAGGHDVRGRVLASIDHREVMRSVEEMVEHVDSIVVSGLFSVYNPAHEKEVKRLIQQDHDIPVVMAHELTGELGFHERTVTAVLNAGLIPVLRDFLEKVQVILSKKGIRAPLMVFKGDGSLMNIRTAMERPVETLLSGPAASAMGGMLLSGKKDCIVIDMGGTSTDIAVMENGRSRTAPNGAVVGSWPTRVEAVNVWTVGLGGDSEIRATKHGLKVGPYRVMPLCFASQRYERLVEKMKALGEPRFLVASMRTVNGLSENEKLLVEHIRKNGPSTFTELKMAFEEMYLIDRHISSLWKQGAIEGIGLTPTDILHVLGIYREGDVEASRIGLKIFSLAHGLEETEMTEKLFNKVLSRIGEELLNKVLSDELGELPKHEAVGHIINGMSGGRRFSNLRLRAKIDHPIVGLGGPARAFLPRLAEMMDVEVIIPDDHEVGNAIGAVCGQVSEFVDVFVYPRDRGFAVYSIFANPIYYTEKADAVAKAKEMASRHAIARAEMSGGHDLKVEIIVDEERERPDSPLGSDALVQIRVRARAVGTPLDGD